MWTGHRCSRTASLSTMRQTRVPELLDGAKNLLDMSLGSTGTYILKRHC